MLVALCATATKSRLSSPTRLEWGSGDAGNPMTAAPRRNYRMAFIPKSHKRIMSLDLIRSRRGQDAMRSCANSALWASCAAVLTVAVSTAYLGLLLQASAAEGGNAGASSDLAVTVVAAKRMCFADTLPVTGVLVPKNEILVRPEREGLQISQVLVEPGDTISSGKI